MAERLPSEVYRELVAMLYGAMVPITIVGITAGCLALVIANRSHSMVTAGIGIAMLLWSSLRILSLLAFRRRISVTLLSRTDAQTWERRYAIGSIGFGALLGCLNIWVLQNDDVAIHMVVTGLGFAYGAGLVVRIGIRPKIYFASLAAAVIPLIIGFLTHMGDAAGYDVPYSAMALLFITFGAGSLESSRFLYRSTVDQLVSRRALADLARQDGLTGLANRLLLRERVVEGLATVNHSEAFVALHLIDLDLFKPVNDLHGHAMGDALLKAVASRISDSIRWGDTAARVGGDEFAVLQIGIETESQAVDLACRLVALLATPFDIDGVIITIGASVGIALAPRDGVDLEILSSRADAALYAAKRQQRGTVAAWTPQLGGSLNSDPFADGR